MHFDFDAIVLGAGSGGLTAAVGLAADAFVLETLPHLPRELMAYMRGRGRRPGEAAVRHRRLLLDGLADRLRPVWRDQVWRDHERDCLLPPAENWLGVPIRAGEMAFRAE